MVYPPEGTCFNCGKRIDAVMSGDGYALYTSEVEFFSPDGLLTERTFVKRLVCNACGQIAADHPIRFPASLEDR